MRRILIKATIDVTDIAVQNFDGTEETNPGNVATSVILRGSHLIDDLVINQARWIELPEEPRGRD